MNSDNPHLGLMRVRTWQRDQSAAVVQATEHEIQLLIDRIDGLTESIARWSEERKKIQSAVIKIQLWRQNEAYRSELIQQKAGLLKELDRLDQRLESERANLLEHEKELKQVEKLIERARQEHQARQQATEQALLDEWSGLA